MEKTWFHVDVNSAFLSWSALKALRQELADATGLPTTLSQTGRVKQEDFEAVARTALNDGAIIVNPAEADYDEIMGILKEVWA